MNEIFINDQPATLETLNQWAANPAVVVIQEAPMRFRVLPRDQFTQHPNTQAFEASPIFSTPQTAPKIATVNVANVPVAEYVFVDPAVSVVVPPVTESAPVETPAPVAHTIEIQDGIAPADATGAPEPEVTHG